jgi:hypothetical protein
MKRHYLLRLLLILVLMGAMWSCRESFDLDEFKDVLIINQPPFLDGLEIVTIEEGDGSLTLDMANYIKDPEGDEIKVENIDSSDPAVATVELEELILTITEVSRGITTVTFILDDGEERDEVVEESFEVHVVEPQFKFSLKLLTVPDGTDFTDFTYTDGSNAGTIISVIEAGEPYSAVVTGGVLEITLAEWYVMGIEFPDPLDLSEDATFVMEYADFFPSVWGDVGMVLALFDANGGEAWIEDPFEDIQNDNPQFSTIEFNVADYADGLDLSQIVRVSYEKWGADGLVPNPTIRIREFALGRNQ